MLGRPPTQRQTLGLFSAAFGDGSAWLAEFCELAYAHDAAWQDGTDFKFTAHGLDDSRTETDFMSLDTRNKIG